MRLGINQRNAAWNMWTSTRLRYAPRGTDGAVNDTPRRKQWLESSLRQFVSSSRTNLH
jgi:hypothetical protein